MQKTSRGAEAVAGLAWLGRHQVELLRSPALIGAGRLIIARIVCATFEIIDEVNHQLRGAGLARELKAVARHMRRLINPLSTLQ